MERFGRALRSRYAYYGIRLLLAIAALYAVNLLFDTTSSANMTDRASASVWLIAAAAGFAGCLAYRIVRLREAGTLSAGGIMDDRLVWLGLAVLFLLLAPRLFTQTALSFMATSFLLIALYALWKKSRGDIGVGTWATLIIAAGVVLRIGFAMAVPLDRFVHDYYYVTDALDQNGGHASYISYLLMNGSLPDVFSGLQRYHPPLFHTLAALFLKTNLMLGFEYGRAYEAIQLLTAFFSCLSLVVWSKTLRLLGLKAKGYLLALSIVALHSCFFIIGVCTNNDVLMWLFTDLCIYFLIRWYKTQAVSDIMLMALSLGLGMMTKVSAVLLALVIGFVFVVKLGESRRQKRAGPLMVQYGLFGLISIPLGMWHPIRSLILYDMPFGYVMRFSENSGQYIGNQSLWQRLIPFRLDTVAASPFPLWEGQQDSNLFIKVIKTALFGEYQKNFQQFSDDSSIMPAWLYAIANYLLILCAIAAMLYVLLRFKECFRAGEKAPFMMLAAFYAVLLGSMVGFSLGHPQMCTLDMRYAVTTIPIGAAFLGVFAERYGDHAAMCGAPSGAKALAGGGPAAYRPLVEPRKAVRVITVLTVSFCVLSAAIFLREALCSVF